MSTLWKLNLPGKVPKPRLGASLLLAISMLLLPTAPATANEQGNGEKPADRVEVKLEIAESPTMEGRDWPIVRMETWQIKDPKTGEVVRTHITTVREAPPGFAAEPSGQACTPDGKPLEPLNHNCAVTHPSVLVTDAETVGGVTGNVWHYAVKKCPLGGCVVTLYDPYRVEVWWTRTGPWWTVRNAVTRWGCQGCLDCHGNTSYIAPYQSAPFTPGWVGNSSYTYIYTADWPPFQPLPDYGYCVIASNTSEVVGGQVYNLFVTANYCGL